MGYALRKWRRTAGVGATAGGLFVAGLVTGQWLLFRHGAQIAPHIARIADRIARAGGSHVLIDEDEVRWFVGQLAEERVTEATVRLMEPHPVHKHK